MGELIIPDWGSWGKQWLRPVMLLHWQWFPSVLSSDITTGTLGFLLGRRRLLLPSSSLTIFASYRAFSLPRTQYIRVLLLFASDLRCCLLLFLFRWLLGKNEERLLVFARKKGFVVCCCLLLLLCAPCSLGCYLLLLSFIDNYLRITWDLLSFAVCDLLLSDISSAILLSLLIFILLLRCLSSTINYLSNNFPSISYLMIMF